MLHAFSRRDLQRHESSSEYADEHMCVEGSQYRPLPSGQTEPHKKPSEV